MAAHSPLTSIGQIMENVLSQRGYLSICREQLLITRWPEIVGDEVARVTRCNRVEEGILYVGVTTAPWRQELSYMKRLILNKIKKECDSITDIVFG